VLIRVCAEAISDPAAQTWRVDVWKH
jgi:hypothetical protein